MTYVQYVQHRGPELFLSCPLHTGFWQHRSSSQQKLLLRRERFLKYVSVFLSFTVLYHCLFVFLPLFLRYALGRVRIETVGISRVRKGHHCSACDSQRAEAGFLSLQHWEVGLWQERKGFPKCTELPLRHEEPA